MFSIVGKPNTFMANTMVVGPVPVRLPGERVGHVLTHLLAYLV